MTRQPPRLAIALIERFVPDSGPLVGDLLEDFSHRQSRVWLWSQSLSAVARALRSRPGDIRPLQLVDQQPLDAIQRTLDLQRQRREVSPTPNPLPASLGLIILGGLVTALAPIIWVGLLVTFVAGLALAGLLTSAHKRQWPPSNARRLT
jgi:hypothetical protein